MARPVPLCRASTACPSHERIPHLETVMKLPLVRLNVRRVAIAVTLVGLALLSGPGHSTSAPPQVSISQVPLTIAVPAHPQIVIAIGNSESMDGNLSGAIMTGS